MHDIWPILSQSCLYLASAAVLMYLLGRRPKHPWCRKCNYDLSSQAAQPGPWTCPECGRLHRHRAQLTRRRRSATLRYLCCALFLAWYAFGVTPRVKSRGWPAALPTWTLALATPWAHQGENREDTLAVCEDATLLGIRVTPGDRLLQELDTRAMHEEIPWPLEYVVAARTRVAFASKSGTTYFACLPRPALDLSYYTRGDSAAFERIRHGLISTTASSLSPVCVPNLAWPVAVMLRSHVPENDRLWQCRAIGNLLFVQSGSPDTEVALQQSFALFDSLRSDPRRLLLEHAADEDLSSLARLHATIISLDARQATVGQLLRVVSQAAGINVSSRSSPLIARSSSEALLVPVPRPCDGVAFLDQVLAAAQAQSGLKYESAADGWTLIHGELAINDGEDSNMLASYHVGYHDLSGIIEGDGGDPLSNWDAIVQAIGGTDPLVEPEALFNDGRLSQALFEGAVPVPPHHVQVETPARTHQALSRALDALRKIGPLQLRDGKLAPKTRIKEQ